MARRAPGPASTHTMRSSLTGARTAAPSAVLTTAVASGSPASTTLTLPSRAAPRADMTTASPMGLPFAKPVFMPRFTRPGGVRAIRCPPGAG